MLEDKLTNKISSFLNTPRLAIYNGPKDTRVQHYGIAFTNGGNSITSALGVEDLHPKDIKGRRTARRGRRTRASKKMRMRRAESFIKRQTINGNKFPSFKEVKLLMPNTGSKEEIFIKNIMLIFNKRGYFWSSVDLTILKSFSLPRTAEHRSVVKDRMNSIIRKFFGKDKATAEQWVKVLGNILDKTIRPARFNNRNPGKCPCGSNVPKKNKPSVRWLNYRAAVANLRSEKEFTITEDYQVIQNQVVLNPNSKKRSMEDAIKYISALPKTGKIRNLSKVESDYFLSLFDQPKKIGKAKIETLLSRFGCQRKMANQLDSILNNEDAEGRTGLCLKCLEKSANGEIPFLSGVPLSRDPRSRQLDERKFKDIVSMLYPDDKLVFLGKEIDIISSEENNSKGGGGQKDRKEGTFLGRLQEEQNGECLFSGFGSCGGHMCTSHIFPRKLCGSELSINKVALDLHCCLR